MSKTDTKIHKADLYNEFVLKQFSFFFFSNGGEIETDRFDCLRKHYCSLYAIIHTYMYIPCLNRNSESNDWSHRSRECSRIIQKTFPEVLEEVSPKHMSEWGRVQASRQSYSFRWVTNLSPLHLHQNFCLFSFFFSKLNKYYLLRHMCSSRRRIEMWRRMDEKREIGRLTNETLRIGCDGLTIVIDVNFLSGEAWTICRRGHYSFLFLNVNSPLLFRLQNLPSLFIIKHKTKQCGLIYRLDFSVLSQHKNRSSKCGVNNWNQSAGRLTGHWWNANDTRHDRVAQQQPTAHRSAVHRPTLRAPKSKLHAHTQTNLWPGSLHTHSLTHSDTHTHIYYIRARRLLLPFPPFFCWGSVCVCVC